MNDQNIFSVNDLHNSENKVLKYLNKMQREALIVEANKQYIVASRGTGKSEGIDATRLLRCIWSMPGSTGGLISPSYAKAWGNTLPAICKALAEWGYIQGIHYFVGKEAPEKDQFKQPKRPPLATAWSSCLHFWNGTVLVVLSFANGMSANSMSLDWLIGPEAKYLSYDKIKGEVNPANRGNSQTFGYSPLHHSVSYSTDMPTSKMGRWILEKRDDMQVQHIKLIKDSYKEYLYYKNLPDQNEYVKRKIKEILRDISMFRRYQKPIGDSKKKREYTVFYGEYDVFDNLEVLGEDFIWEMYRDSPPLIWRTAFLNERLLKVADGFYPALEEEIHFYYPSEPTDLNIIDFDKKQSNTCLTDYDLDFNAPLHIAFDSNSPISSVVICQLENNKMKVVKSDFVKTPLKLQHLVDKVCKYYSFKSNKDIVFYYDHTFTWTSGTMEDSYADTIVKEFETNSFSVTPVYIGQQPPYEWRHKQIDLALRGSPELLFPIFNLPNNEYLKVAMEQAGVKLGKNGFEKDKSAEKLPDSPDSPDEYKTHITDAFDTLFVGVNLFRTEPSFISGGVIFLGR